MGWSVNVINTDGTQEQAAYDAWAKPLVQAKKWPEAIEVAEKALARFPDNKHLQRNLKYLKQQRDK